LPEPKLGVGTILQALPQAGELGEAVGALADEPLIPLAGVAAKLSVARKIPAEQSANEIRMHGLKKPE
jgi:hypothetical protein